MSYFGYEPIYKCKSEIRLKLERICKEIHLSWIRDIDKSKELLELIDILEMMLRFDEVDKFFEDCSDLEYFVTKFSKEVVSIILKQPVVLGENGDDLALEVLSLFLFIAVKCSDNPKVNAILDNVYEILDSSKPYFKGVNQITAISNSLNAKKQQSASDFNSNLPMKEPIEFEEKELVDVFISTGYYSSNRKFWTRGVISKVNKDSYEVFTAENNYITKSKKSFDLAKMGTMIKDSEWRKSLKINDMVDCFGKGKWLPSTILKVNKDELNGLIKLNYFIGFRMYYDVFPQATEYKAFWTFPEIGIDKNCRKYIGNSEHLDEMISCWSTRIQPFNSQTIEKKNIECSDTNIDDQIPFDYEVQNEIGELVSKKTYIIGKGNSFVYFYALLLSRFAELGGFDYVLSKCKTCINSENIHNAFTIFGYAASYFHKEYINNTGWELLEYAKKYLEALPTMDSKSMKKISIEIIVQVLKMLGSGSQNSEFIEVIDNFNLSCSVNLIKSPSLDKKIQALKTLVDLITEYKTQPKKKEKLLAAIKGSQIVNEIFGPNSHIHLIAKSRELMELIIREGEISEGELQQIWGAASKGDLESKMAVIKILGFVLRSMSNVQAEKLISYIFASKPTDLLSDELEVS